MAKMRIHELAKELDVKSKDIINVLQNYGVNAESHMTILSDKTVDFIKKVFKLYKEKAEKEAQEGVKTEVEINNEKAEEPAKETGASSNDAKKPEEQEKPEAKPAKKTAKAKKEEQPVSSEDPKKEVKAEEEKAEEKEAQKVEGLEENKVEKSDESLAEPVEEKAKKVKEKAEEKKPQIKEKEVKEEEKPRKTVRTPQQIEADLKKANKAEADKKNYRRKTDRGDRKPLDNDRKERVRDKSASRGEGSEKAERSERPARRRNDERSQDQRRPFDKDTSESRGRDNTRGRSERVRNEASEGVPSDRKDNRNARRNFKDSKDKMRDQERDRKGGKKQEKNIQLEKKTVGPPVHKQKPVEEKPEIITILDTITIKDLADKMKVSASDIIKKLFMQGKIVNVNSDLSFEEAEAIALEFEIMVDHEEVVDVIEEMLREEEEDEKDLKPRPPVVCVMGHVDHGKTSILDAIRKTNVTSGEAGGITQHIGAYTINIHDQNITFLDTPGHEAFTAMRLRGAQATDIAILVVAADDGVMPQTVEAINHAKAAGVDIIVAINKIDKPEANIDRVKQELTEYELVAEDWGGQTIMVPVSAHSGEGLDTLLDMILLDAEVKELKANPDRNARGIVLEAKLDKGMGPVATVLVQKGTLNVGDNIAIGTAYGKVRAMTNDKGKRVKTAGPSVPVEVQGLNEVPESGEIMVATDTDREAKNMAATFVASKREKLLKDTKSRLNLDSIFEQIKEGNLKELDIVVKADVQGSVEALKQSLEKLSNDEVAVKVIHSGVGAVNGSDVMLASASNALIIGFNVRPDAQAKIDAERDNVDIRLYKVIYNAIEDVESAMKGMLEPTYEDVVIGHAEVRATYKASGVGTVIGGYMLDGKMERNCKAKLFRDNIMIYDGAVASLRRFKDDVKEVLKGYEFGMTLENYNDIKEGDQIEAYEVREVQR